MSDKPVFSRTWKLRRFRMSLTIYRHRGVLPDRWVILPRFVYDTAPRSRNVLGR